jgi:hypothetical protein
LQLGLASALADSPGLSTGAGAGSAGRDRAMFVAGHLRQISTVGT